MTYYMNFKPIKILCIQKKADDGFTEHKTSMSFESVFLELIDILLSRFFDILRFVLTDKIR
jgi:hypothetical protein